MLEGMVLGGWQFIVPAYLITVFVLAAYVWSISARRRRLERKDQDNE